MTKAPRTVEFPKDLVRDISERVYRIRLEQDCKGNVERMIAKDKDNGEKLRNRSESYDSLTRTYLHVIKEMEI